MKRILILSIILCFINACAFGQTDVIEIDSITRSAVRTAPFDKPFLIKAQIDAEEVKRVFLVKKVRNKTLDGSIEHHINHGETNVPQFAKNYFWTRKVGDKNYLFISVADTYMFKPSQSYFIIPDLRQTDPSVIRFFDLYYQFITTKPSNPVILNKAKESLFAFEKNMKKIFGNNIVFGFMTKELFEQRQDAFRLDFDKYLAASYKSYENSKAAFNSGLAARVGTTSTNWPSFDSLTRKQLLTDTLMNKEAVIYLSGKDFAKNDMISDLNTLQQVNRINDLLSGVIGLHCIYCEGTDISSNTAREINKRIANIDSSIKHLALLQRTLYLLKPKATSGSTINNSIINTGTLIAQLKNSKDSLTSMIRQRKGIEDVIMDNFFAKLSFTYSQVLSGNTYMNFDTRNKLLLTPDFGVVTASVTKAGKDLEYGIIPYLGFHINLMAVDKDITFKTYKKHILQRFSLMVGWSLVNMNQDSVYANFFEKSSLLTGAGFRWNNVIRTTFGVQSLFKLGKDANGKQTRMLVGNPYIGLSFDLNIKQYLNGFTDILSGIGKTKPNNQNTVSTNAQ